MVDNQDDPFEEMIKKVRKTNIYMKSTDNRITDRYNTLVDPKDVIFYPRVDVSLNQFRKEEAKLTKSLRKRGSSFLELFRKRLASIDGKRERISITLFVDIQDGLLIQKGTFGPFTMDIPRLSKRDICTDSWYTHFWTIILRFCQPRKY